MGNPLRGEVTIPGSVHSLRYDVNVLCEVEEAFGKSFPEIVNDLQANPSLRLIRKLFWCGLRGSRQGASLSETAAGDIIGDIGFKAAAELIGDAINAAHIFPETEADTVSGEG